VYSPTRAVMIVVLIGSILYFLSVAPGYRVSDFQL